MYVRILEHLAHAPGTGCGAGGTPPDTSRVGVLAEHGPVPAARGLETMPLLAAMTESGIEAIRGRGVVVDVAVGHQVIRGWDVDRSFSIALSGRFYAFIDDRWIRRLAPGVHVGEVAVRDWESRLQLHPDRYRAVCRSRADATSQAAP
jgi:hypothetical protein